MSVLGINQYVLENHEKDIYDFLMSIIDDYKKQGKPEGYNIGTFQQCPVQTYSHTETN